jgi:hypothetical protein
MKQEGIITKSREYIQLENGEVFSISKYQKNHGLSEGQKVVVKIDTEYPESCDNSPFCEGDESCIICLYNNKVAVLEI